jgi:hypothetical protein
MSLTRLYVDSNSIKYAVNILQNYIIKNNYKGFICTDCFDKIYTEKFKYIPQKFNNNLVFISADSFQQNHIKLSKLIRKDVMMKIKDVKEIVCIGGESYIYGLTSNVNKIYHYTNSDSIFNDMIYNNKIYRKNISNNIVDYNTINMIQNNTDMCLINLSQLNINLMKQINNNNYNNIVIINCNSDDFWKKIKLLSRYKLVSREKYICYTMKYFITFNFFQRLQI